MATPEKRAVERFWLLYTPVWSAVVGLVMVGGWAERWGDVPLMILGVGVALPAVVGPILTRVDKRTPWWRSTAFTLGLSVVGLAFGLNYTQTPYFWDVLHMHYGFNATWTIQNNPIFLYFLTIAYFATYAALCLRAWRWLSARGRLAGAVAWVAVPLLMALLETVLNANPFTRRLFCYDDMGLMLWFGTLSYGVAFVLALPMWVAIDEHPDQQVPWSRVLVMVGAVLYADLIALDVLRYQVAPHVTTVEAGANGLRDFENSCLVGTPPDT